MIFLNDFEKIGFHVSWKLLDIGYRYSADPNQQIPLDEIMHYAIERLELNFDDELILKLVGEYNSNVSDIDKEKICNIIYALAKKESSDAQLEFRKWRVVLLIKRLEQLNENCIDGLISLSDFWTEFGRPPESPHVFQGIGNDISPESYYTEKNYETIRLNHYYWLENEIEFIKTNQ